jgi:transcriptional regulator with XRE-family HTH domain
MQSKLNSEKLKAMRTRAGLSQWQVASAMNRTQGWLSNIELGYVKPHQNLMLVIEMTIKKLKEISKQ